MRAKYGEYLVAHRRARISIPPIRFSEVDAWHNELARLREKVVTPFQDRSEVMQHG